METQELSVSIRSCLDEELRFEEVDLGWALRSGPTLLASLVKVGHDEVRCDTRDGTWRLTSRRGSRFDVYREGSDEPVARYLPHVLRGGRIELGGEQRYRLRPPPIWAERWRVTQSLRGPALLTIQPVGYHFRVAFGAPARPLLDLPLLTVIALRGVLLETNWGISAQAPMVPGP
jgi:hypothetical protein